MIAPTRPTDLSPILPPQLGKRGPVRPGDTIPIRLPLRAMSGTDIRDEVVVTFHADAASCEPKTLRLGVLRAGESIIAETVATVAPLNGKREVTVWADVSFGTRQLASGKAKIGITARSSIAIQAIDDGLACSVQVLNCGDAPTEIRIETIGSAVPQCAQVTLHEDRPGRGISQPIALSVGEEREFTLVGARIDHLLAIAEDGERAAVQPQRRFAVATSELIPEFSLDALEEGVRLGDIVRFSLKVTNPASASAEDLAITFARNDDLALMTDAIAIDGVRVIPNDLDQSAHESVVLKAGRIAAGEAITITGAFAVTLANPKEIDALLIGGTITARDCASYRFDAEALVDRRPAFAPSTTYLSAIEPDDFGNFAIRGAVTNADPMPIERLRVRLDIEDAVPHDHARVNGENVRLRPTALHEGASLFVELGKLDAGARTTFMLKLAPMRGEGDMRTMRVRALLHVDDHLVPLGTSEYLVPGLAKLDQSSLKRRDERPLRLGMPCEATLTIRNDGTTPARDIRLSLDLPKFVGASLPEAESGSRWRKIASMLPPGGSIATTITFFLTEPPQSTATTIAATVDAESHAPITVGEIHFETPTDPLVDPPAIQSQPLDDGRIAFLARVVNHGDGRAEAITLRVLDPEFIMPRSTSVDGIASEDIGPRSILASNLHLGTIGPGEFRDIMWHVAPPNDLPYRTTLQLAYAGGPIQTATSIPTRARILPTLASALPEARRLSGAIVGERSARRPTVTLLKDHRKNAINAMVDTPALPGIDFSANDERTQLTAPPEAHAARTDDVALHARAQTATESAQPEANAQPTRQQDSAALANTEPAEGTTAPQEALLGPTVLREGTDAPAPLSAGGEATELSVHTISEPAASLLPNPTDELDELMGGTLPPNVAEHAEEIAGAAVIERTTLTLPTLSLTPIAFSSALTMGEQLLEAPLSWWRHSMMMRLLISDTFAAESEVTEIKELRALLTAPIRSAFPKLFAPDFDLSDAWLDTITANDRAAAALVARVAEKYVVLAPKPEARAHGIIIDSVLPHLLPETVLADEAADAFSHYKETLLRAFNYSSIIALANEEERREKYGAMQNSTLDECLGSFLKVAREPR